MNFKHQQPDKSNQPIPDHLATKIEARWAKGEPLEQIAKDLNLNIDWLRRQFNGG